jgi:hypothetical protein
MGLVGTFHEEHTVTLEIPQNASLKIQGEDDDYQIRQVQGKIYLDFEDGDAVIKNCLGGRYEFEIEDGCIEMEGGKGTLSAYAEDGEIVISNAAFDEIDAEIEDGEIEIATALKDGGEYYLRCEDGDIELTVLQGGGEFQVDYADGNVHAFSDFKRIEGDQGHEVYCLSGGNAKVRLRAEDGDVRLSTR